jgi:sec-independent protein translocase protein TatC
VSAVYDDEADIEASRAPLMDHLVELRRRLIVCIGSLAVSFLVCFFFAKQIALFLLRPLVVASTVMAAQHAGHAAHDQPFDILFTMLGLKALPAGAAAPAKVIFTAPLEVLFANVKIGIFGALVLSFPILAFQLYRFVAPGLYRRERKAFLPFLVAAPVLFVAGAALVYFVMLPFVLWFSLNQQITSPDVQVQQLLKVSDYLDLVTKLLLAFGLCFQLPVVVTLAGMAGLIEAKTLAQGRRYALLGIVVVSALVTPPDMISPFLLAGPIYALYEASIWCVRLIELRRKREEQAGTDIVAS